MRDVAEEVFQAPVRMARPARVSGLGENFQIPGFSGASGLLKWEMSGGAGALAPQISGGYGNSHAGSFIEKATSWLRENF
jgi:cell division protein FtsA